MFKKDSLSLFCLQNKVRTFPLHNITESILAKTIKHNSLKTAALISLQGLQEEHADLHAAAWKVSGSYRFDSIEQMTKLEATWLSVKPLKELLSA